ncbi:hypothetical protein J6590_105301, partial [Homalodisca vitripennis]
MAVKGVVNENENLKLKNVALEKQISFLKTQCENFEQYSKLENIQIDGIPEVKGENVMNIVNKLSIAVDEPVVLNMDVQAAHRIPTKKESAIRPIAGTFPAKLKTAVVIPVHKAGDKQEISNYRPISLLSCLSKILETH